MQRSRGILDAVNVGEVEGIHFNSAEFDALIAAHGSSGELRRSLYCPCVRIDTRTPDASCKHCNGIGKIYPEKLREPLIFLDSSRTANQQWAAAGVVVKGTIQVTFPTGTIPGEGDMILPDGEEHVVHEQLFREGANRVDDGLLRIHRQSPDAVKPALKKARERLLYPTRCCVEHVAYRRGPELLSAHPSEYHVAEDGTWTWRGDAGPEPGHSWSVRYRAAAVYVVHDAVPRLRVEQDTPMPYLVTAKRLDKHAFEDQRP